MCKECGCGSHENLPGSGSPGQHELGGMHFQGTLKGQPHAHPHPHDHGHGESDLPVSVRRTLEIRKPVLDKNDRVAERNRDLFRSRGILALNVLSSPGSGKTALLAQTLRHLSGMLRAAVIVGDLATENDAERLRVTHAPVVQVTTGTMCHLEAEMVAKAAGDLDLNALDLLIIENVGNLVCPAAYDLGEDFRVVLLSVTEGEDKPLKYPPVFQAADVVLISKIDLAEPCGFDRELALRNLRKMAPKAEILEVSAKTGQGMNAWLELLLSRHAAARCHVPLEPG